MNCLEEMDGTAVQLMTTSVEGGDRHFAGLHVAPAIALQIADSGCMMETLSIDASFMTPLLNSLSLAVRDFAQYVADKISGVSSASFGKCLCACVGPQACPMHVTWQRCSWLVCSTWLVLMHEAILSHVSLCIL